MISRVTGDWGGASVADVCVQQFDVPSPGKGSHKVTAHFVAPFLTFAPIGFTPSKIQFSEKGIVMTTVESISHDEPRSSDDSCVKC